MGGGGGLGGLLNWFYNTQQCQVMDMLLKEYILCVWVHMHAHVCAHVHACACVCVCVCVLDLQEKNRSKWSVTLFNVVHVWCHSCLLCCHMTWHNFFFFFFFFTLCLNVVYFVVRSYITTYFSHFNCFWFILPLFSCNCFVDWQIINALFSFDLTVDSSLCCCCGYLFLSWNQTTVCKFSG